MNRIFALGIMQVSKTLLYLTVGLIFSFHPVISQNQNVGVGVSTPHPSAFIQLADNRGKGFKIPYTDTNAVYAFVNSFNPPAPIANGLLIFQKNAETFYYYDGAKSKWIPLNGVTGPTGIRGVTGPTGPTGPFRYSSRMRYGSGAPFKVKGDTCDSYYLDLSGAYLYRYKCPNGPWQFRGGTYKNKIKGGLTVNLSTTTKQTRVLPASAGSTNMKLIDGLKYTVVAPPGYEAYAWMTAYGTVKKVDVNNDYNFAKFDFYYNTPISPAGFYQLVSLPPSGSGPDFHNENISWSISVAANLGSLNTIEVWGGQNRKTQSGLGDIIIADGPGSDCQAHLDMLIVFIKN